MSNARFHEVSEKTEHFLQIYEALSFAEKLNFLAVLFEQMENGQINSENSTEPNKVDDNGGHVFYPADAGLPNGIGIGHNILAQARKIESEVQ